MTTQPNPQPEAGAAAGATGRQVGETGPNVDGLAKLPYRAARIAIPAAIVALAMARALEAAEQAPGYRPGVPIVGQAGEVEETYWRTVWHRLGRPDPGLTD